MKKIFIVFMILILAFAAVWITKSKTPAYRPDSYVSDIPDDAWWLVKLDNSNVKQEWILDPEIPENYLPVIGQDELYMVIDENGNIVKYRHRVKQADGSWVWEDINPDIPENYEPVEGVENVYKVTDADGNIYYVKYIRNDDGTFAFVLCDEKGNLLGYDDPEGEDIPSNYKHVAGNVYAVEDENGVVVEYKERTLDDEGTYHWGVVYKPTDEDLVQYNTLPTLPVIDPENPFENSDATMPSDFETSSNEQMSGLITDTPTQEYEYTDDGRYTKTETFNSTETKDGWTITYQTTVISVYDSEGNLLSTSKEGPVEIDRVQISGTAAADPSQVADTLTAEYARISVGISFNENIVQQMLAGINAERVASGKPQLTLDTGGDNYLLAHTRAAAMAAFDYGDYNSPIYGTLDDMCIRYGIAADMPSENTWRTTSDKTADGINNKFLSLDASRETLLSTDYSQVGIAVAEKNGYYYISEIFIS